MGWLPGWLKDSIRYAKKSPALAVAMSMNIVCVLALVVVVLRLTALTAEVRQEAKDSIQRNCDMNFASGQAILDTASVSSTIPPVVITRYQHFLARYANDVLRKYDPKFHCNIPTTTLP